MNDRLKRNLSIIILISSIAGSFASEFKNVGHSGANFLQIPVEPAGAALGEAYVGHARGVDGLYWNPGAISYTEGTEILLATGDWIIDTRLSFLGITRDLGHYGAAGISITAFTMDEMEITTEFQPNGTGEFFNAGNYAVGISYGLNLTDRFSFGGTAKYVYEYIWETNASAIAFDFGSVYRSNFRNLRIGMRLANFGGDLRMQGDPIDNKPDEIAQSQIQFDKDPRLDRVSEEYNLPQEFTVGIALDPYHSDQNRVTLLVSAKDPNDNDTRLNFGGEYAFRETVMLRAGYKNGYDEQGLTFGLGLALKLPQVTSRFDYGFSDFGILGSIHYLSFRVSL